jgi:hypothetical protein
MRQQARHEVAMEEEEPEMRSKVPNRVWGVIAAGATCVAAASAAARDHYVATNGDGTAATNWSTAYTNIQTALSAATGGDGVLPAGATMTGVRVQSGCDAQRRRTPSSRSRD